MGIIDPCQGRNVRSSRLNSAGKVALFVIVYAQSPRLAASLVWLTLPILIFAGFQCGFLSTNARCVTPDISREFFCSPYNELWVPRINYC